MRTSAIIVAAGSGTRLGFAEPKAFVKVGGRTMLHHAFATLAQLNSLNEIIVTIPPGMEKRARDEASRAAIRVPLKITPGGTERQDSVRIALAIASAESELVVVHDAARPFADADLFNRCIDAAARSGAAIAAIPVADTLKRVAEGTIIGTVRRAGLYQAQTPQAFQRRLLVAAHERAMRDRVVATDDAELVEQIRGTVEIVEASAMNLKITTKGDLAMAERLAAKR